MKYTAAAIFIICTIYFTCINPSFAKMAINYSKKATTINKIEGSAIYGLNDDCFYCYDKILLENLNKYINKEVIILYTESDTKYTIIGIEEPDSGKQASRIQSNKNLKHFK